MRAANIQKARSLKGLAVFFVIWALIPGALALAVIGLFDRLSKYELLTILVLTLIGLMAAVTGGAILAIRNLRADVEQLNR